VKTRYILKGYGAREGASRPRRMQSETMGGSERVGRLKGDLVGNRVKRGASASKISFSREGAIALRTIETQG